MGWNHDCDALGSPDNPDVDADGVALCGADGVAGTFFEVTPTGETVWTYELGQEVFRVTRYPSSYAGLP